MKFDEKVSTEMPAGLRATIEEIARAKGITYAEALHQAITIVEEMIVRPADPTPPSVAGRHLPIGDAFTGCVAWCPACRELARRHA